MKVKDLLGKTVETVADGDCESQKIMTKGAYMKQVGSGIYSLYTPARRITRKIEAIIREEMDRIDGQEVLFPVVMPAALWKSSGRYFSIGSEMVRFADRSGKNAKNGQDEYNMVLGMTHEEAAVHLANNAASSYSDYPFMIYQIQTKFRDEPRSRAGLIRVREFTMKDAYSFHTSQEDLEAYYERAYHAYERIFARAGIPEVIAVKSDSGMMGGSVSHEFMLLTGIGEDTIAICPECGYKANMEAAECICDKLNGETAPLTEVETPEQKTIADVCSYLHADPAASCKAVVYRRKDNDRFVAVFIRGDLEVNETKLRNAIGSDIYPAEDISDADFDAGFIGPVGLRADCDVVYDRSLQSAPALVCGANKPGYHYTGLNMERDCPNAVYTDVARITAGGICQQCGKKTITIQNGIEVGNIFQLGTKYTEAMDMTYTDRDNTQKHPIMGCYGIGVGRLVASACEARRYSRTRFDKKAGKEVTSWFPVWPMTIAPWQVQICALNAAKNEEVHAMADRLYKELQDLGVEVLYDDRAVSVGSMLSDADLMGVPMRILVSPKTLNRGAVEYTRLNVDPEKTVTADLAPDEAAKTVAADVKAALAALNNIE